MRYLFFHLISYTVFLFFEVPYYLFYGHARKYFKSSLPQGHLVADEQPSYEYNCIQILLRLPRPGM